MRRIVKAGLVLLSIIIIGVIGMRWASHNTIAFLFPQVWSQSSPYGDGYEFKVNHVPLWTNKLETGFLSTIDRVVVTDIQGREYELERDYEINDYSGEVTRRFVLYGPQNSFLPETGEYQFDFIIDDEIVLTMYKDYVQDYLRYPTDVTWERRGDDIYVEWIPPPGLSKKNWYKVLIWSIDDTPDAFVSLKFDGDASSGLLEDVPFIEEGRYQVNVAVYSGVGYAYSYRHNFIWDSDAKPIPDQESPATLYPQVWAQSSPYGDGYEFKVNDASFETDELEVGFLSTVDRVVVTDPQGREYELERDYNINEYSGEVTRRFVLYGPQDSFLPETGEYRFDFIIENEIILSMNQDYVQSYLRYPTNVTWERMGDDVHVEWTPPPGLTMENWYKVLIWSIDDTPDVFVSLSFEGDATSGLLEDVPFIEGGKYQVNVAVYSDVGYAYSYRHNFIWDNEATPLPD